MIHFDENAKIHLENYLKKVKGYLNCCKTVNTDEVIQNIIDHVEGELGHLSCVSTEQLNPVLKTLGSPERWIPQEELSLWKKIILRFRIGPEDWRLSYFSFILLVTSLCLLPHKDFGPEMIFMLPVVAINNMLSFVLFIASFILARAAIGVNFEQNQHIGSQKWLLYPALILTYTPILFFIALWPAVPVAVSASANLNQNDAMYKILVSIASAVPGSPQYIFIWACITVFILSIWGILLSFLFSRHLQLFKKLFFPFLETFNKKLIRVILKILLVLMFVSLCAGLVVKYLI